MSPEICFNLDQCKVLLSDNGLKEIGPLDCWTFNENRSRNCGHACRSDFGDLTLFAKNGLYYAPQRKFGVYLFPLSVCL